MALADLKLAPITKKRAAHYTEGRTEPVRAFINHRMVGYLAGTDAYFQNPATRPVSTHFGIGYGADGVVRISQYVPLDDTAYGNGNYDPSGKWDDWGFKVTEINAQTISIEHQDHGDPAGKGVVSDKTQAQAIRLIALLRYGSLAQWKAAGIWVRDWDRNGPILRDEIRRIPVDGKHIGTHHDIAGKLKPTCWLPWEKDEQGYPRDKYVRYVQYWGDILVNGPAPTVPTTPVTYTQAQVDAIQKAAQTTIDALRADNLQLQEDLTKARAAVKAEAIAAITALP